MVKTLLLCVSIILFELPLSGCQSRNRPLSPIKNSTTIPLVSPSKGDDLNQFVGKLITIRGKISATKIPQIEGIDIDVEAVILDEQKEYYAIGTLMKTAVKAEDIDNSIPNRGTGTFYSLINGATGQLATARPVSK